MAVLNFKEKQTVLGRASWLAAAYTYEVLDSPVFPDFYYDKFIVPFVNETSQIKCGFFDEFFEKLALAKSGMEVPRDNEQLNKFANAMVQESVKAKDTLIHPPILVALVKCYFNIDTSH